MISDWQGVDKIYSPDHSNYSDAVLKAINAGIDMVCACTHSTLSVGPFDIWYTAGT